MAPKDFAPWLRRLGYLALLYLTFTGVQHTAEKVTTGKMGAQISRAPGSPGVGLRMAGAGDVATIVGLIRDRAPTDTGRVIIIPPAGAGEHLRNHLVMKTRVLSYPHRVRLRGRAELEDADLGEGILVPTDVSLPEDRFRLDATEKGWAYWQVKRP